MKYFKKCICKIENFEFYAKMERNFYISWYECTSVENGMHIYKLSHLLVTLPFEGSKLKHQAYLKSINFVVTESTRPIHIDLSKQYGDGFNLYIKKEIDLKISDLKIILFINT